MGDHPGLPGPFHVLGQNVARTGISPPNAGADATSHSRGAIFDRGIYLVLSSVECGSAQGTFASCTAPSRPACGWDRSLIRKRFRSLGAQRSGFLFPAR